MLSSARKRLRDAGVLRLTNDKGHTLRPYQDYFRKLIREKKQLMLTVPMGMGKTIMVLSAIRDLLDQFEIERVLIVAPLRVAENTWPDEILDWYHTRSIRFSVLTGTPANRKAAAQKNVPIHIINRENIRWLVEYWGDRWPYDMIVYDESSRLKSGKKRTVGKKDSDGSRKGRNLSEFGALCSIRKYVDRVVELSGTPAPNGLKDLWGQAYFADLGERLGTARTAFEKRWFDSDYMGWNLTPKPNAQEEIMARLEDMMFSLRAEDHIDLPPIVYNNVCIKLPSSIMDQYRQFERDSVSLAYDVEAQSRGVLTNKLLQFANGSMYRSVEGRGKPVREIVPIHDLKMDALDSIVQEASGRPILLAYSFKFDLERIKKKYPKAVLFDEEPNAVKLWNKGKIPMLLSHPASIGHGLNMQYGGNIAVWFGLTWSLELYQQFNKRLPRPGQSADHVYIHHIIAKGTADEDVLDVLASRDAVQDDITSRVRARILATKRR